MEFNVTITCDNAAFAEEEGGPHNEVARILHNLADSLERDHIDQKKLLDINGTSVGKAAFSE